MSKNGRVEEPEVLPREDAQEQEGSSPNPGMRRRRERRSGKESVEEEELTERALLVKLLGKGERSNEILSLYDKSRVREGRRRSEFEGSQRSFIEVLMTERGQSQKYIDTLLERVFAFANQLLEMYGKLSEAKSGSKVQEATEIMTLIASTPIGQALQNVAVEKLTKKDEENFKKLEARNQALEAKIKQLEAKPSTVTLDTIPLK